jgi:hypothetical protein
VSLAGSVVLLGRVAESGGGRPSAGSFEALQVYLAS